MVSLILEGGSFRGVFSAGVMDALLEHDIMVPYCIGVSAGISNGVSYISKQKGRNLEVFKKYRNDKRYISKGNLIKQRSVFGLDFVYDEIPNQLEKFDWDTYHAYEGKVVVVVTDALTGKPVYLNGMKMDKKFTMLRATCALPVAFPAIMIKGRPYYDGGLSDPIPVKKAIQDGCDKHIIVLTRPKGYVKDVNGEAKIIDRVFRHKYPHISDALLHRHIGYNETVALCEQLEKEGKAIIFRPEHPIESFEKDVNVLEKSYQMGFEMVNKRIEDLKKFVQ